MRSSRRSVTERLAVQGNLVVVAVEFRVRNNGVVAAATADAAAHIIDDHTLGFIIDGNGCLLYTSDAADE